MKSKRGFFSLQSKVFLFSLVLCVAPLLLVGMYAYSQSSRFLEEKVSRANYDTVEQIGNSMEFIFQDAHDISMFLIQNEDVFSLLKSGVEDTQFRSRHYRLQRNLGYLIGSKQYFHSLNIIGKNGVVIQTTTIQQQNHAPVEDEIAEARGDVVWNSQTITEGISETTRTLSMYRTINDINQITTSLGFLAVNINEEKLCGLYRSHISHPDDIYYLLDENDRILSSVDKSLIGRTVEEPLRSLLHSAETGYHKEALGGKSFLIASYPVKGMDWKLVSVLSLAELMKENSSVKGAFIILICSSILFCFLAAALFAHYVLGPLKKLRSMMHLVEKEEFDQVQDLEGNDEIAALSRTFKHMSLHIRDLFEQVYRMEIRQKEAELKVLQAQINPHFLYNTLDTIYWTARMEKAFGAGRLIRALSSLFRLSLNSGMELTAVKREVEHLQSYIIIQQQRYDKKIEFLLRVEPDTLECQTINLVLQPLVENAIIHGMEPREDAGKIEISVYSEDGCLCYAVEDDGPGVNPDEINRLLTRPREDGHGLALKNVNERIRLYAGENYGIQFIDTGGKGALVLVRQPLRQFGEENRTDENSNH